MFSATVTAAAMPGCPHHRRRTTVPAVAVHRAAVHLLPAAIPAGDVPAVAIDVSLVFGKK